MKRRDFLKTTALLALLPAAAFAAEGNWTHYRPGVVDALLKDGKTVFLDFSAVWCGTCKAQERRISQLMGENAAYVENVTFVRVDWDAYSNAAITFDLEIPRRSTLVVLKGDEELGRIVAGNSRQAIKGLMDTALAAATA
ncbi:MAG: thioredoxin family protein [Paracoccaceae bacterium]|nr:thioredoxin family protein [Paracoccaceae bacterium]MDG1768252.1 thioredoxin family protein [Yoonia sp.]MDG2259539.1 thioredoxin family protein [Paracoccaceae bacterium]